MAPSHQQQSKRASHPVRFVITGASLLALCGAGAWGWKGADSRLAVLETKVDSIQELSVKLDALRSELANMAAVQAGMSERVSAIKDRLDRKGDR